MLAREEMVQELAADSGNDGTEEDWSWFITMIPIFLNWVIRKWGNNVIYVFKIPILKNITITVGWLIRRLMWVLEKFGPKGTPAPEPHEETVS